MKEYNLLCKIYFPEENNSVKHMFQLQNTTWEMIEIEAVWGKAKHYYHQTLVNNTYSCSTISPYLIFSSDDRTSLISQVIMILSKKQRLDILF